MQSNAARAALLVALVAASVVLFVVLSGSDDSDNGAGSGGGDAQTEVTGTTAPAVATIGMRDGAPVGGVRKLTYEKGERIRLEIDLDEPQEDVHIHGYEEEVLSPAKVARFDFPAELDGVFELEAHGPDGDVVLAEIVVNPG